MWDSFNSINPLFVSQALRSGIYYNVQFSCSVMSDSLWPHVWLFVTPWTAALQASLSITISRSLLKFKSIESVMPSSHLILCHLFLVPSIFLSIRVFSNELAFMLPWTAAHLAYLSFTISQSLLKLTSIELVMPSNHLVLCRPLLLCLQSFPASGSFQMSQLFFNISFQWTLKTNLL